jgi:hypothetical protein
MRSLGLVLSLGFGLFAASAAGAAAVSPVGLRVETNGVFNDYFDESEMGCTDGDGATFQCAGGNLTVGDLRLDTWNMTFDPDPVVTGITSVTNVGLVVQQFTLTFTLPVAPVLPSSLMGGSIQGGVTDNTLNSSNAVLSTVLGSSFYTALIDGVSVQTLYNHTSTVTAPFDGGSANLAAASFGLPGVTLPGPAANASIGIRLDFTLTPGDSASFTSNFFVIPVPEPGTGLLLAFGLGALALRRRRA